MKIDKQKEPEQLTKQESDILCSLYQEPFINQRILSETSGHSLGVVNRLVKILLKKGFINEQMQLTRLSYDTFKLKAPKNAVILAAGFGMRMVPINLTTPKAFLEVNGERLIDRLISQLHDVGITDITVVVGFMKDSFEYLMDEYGVELVVNEEYAEKNNISSLAMVLDKLSNTYIVPCDIWCDRNPFRKQELYSWYMVSDQIDYDSTVRVNRKSELAAVNEWEAGNEMIGISYLLVKEADKVKKRITELIYDGKHDDSFWEEALYYKDRMIVQARVVHGENVVEINTYEQLRELDSDSNQLKSDVIEMIADTLGISSDEVVDISVLKKGMTNKSFLFKACGKKYIMRIPGEGTEKLINRKNETVVFKTISGKGLCDDPLYINYKNGYKITSFLDGVRGCDSHDVKDLNRCMEKLKKFHSMKLTVPHTFDIFGQIEFYEMLWEGEPSIYRDYRKTKANVMSLKDFIDSQEKDWCLTHIDAVPDNFLFYQEDGEEKLQLTDWEYSGMQDPHVDIAMFCIYSLYNKRQTDRLIDIYFENQCKENVRVKIYCYIAACGLLWSNWCEYKRKFGVEFGEYSLRQYRFAKDYYRHASERIKEVQEGE